MFLCTEVFSDHTTAVYFTFHRDRETYKRRKEFTLESDVEKDKTKLKVNVSKLETIEATADTTKKKGEKTNIWLLVKVADFSKKVKAKEAIKKGDTLAITVETA
jgi:molybdopterin converting factor small subunit